MINDNGPYGPNEASNNVVAAQNSSQSDSSNVNHNLFSFSKIVDQTASSNSGPFEAHNVPNFEQLPMTIHSQRHQSLPYETTGHPSFYLPQSNPFYHENALQNSFLVNDMTTQAEHHHNMLNFHENVQKAPSELETAFEYESSLSNNHLLKSQRKSQYVRRRRSSKSSEWRSRNHETSTETRNRTLIAYNLLVNTEIYHHISTNSFYKNPFLRSMSQNTSEKSQNRNHENSPRSMSLNASISLGNISGMPTSNFTKYDGINFTKNDGDSIITKNNKSNFTNNYHDISTNSTSTENINYGNSPSNMSQNASTSSEIISRMPATNFTKNYGDNFTNNDGHRFAKNDGYSFTKNDKSSFTKNAGSSFTKNDEGNFTQNDGDFLMNSRQNHSNSPRAMSFNTMENKSEILSSNFTKKDEEISMNLSQNNAENIPQLPTTVLHKTSIDETNFDNSLNHSRNTLVNGISEKKRQSLEKTVRLIESIITRSTNNTKSNVITDPLALSPNPTANQIKNDSQTEDLNSISSEGNRTDSDEEVLIKKISRKQDSRSPSKKIQSTRRSHVIETETEVQFEKRIKGEHDNVNVKSELLEHNFYYSCDIDYVNPFHRDKNGISKHDVGDMKVISMENSVEEALNAVKNGTKSPSYFECPHCSLLLLHPKRFLIHTKWHTFGLLNKKRAEMAREHGEKIQGKREAKSMQRLSATEADGVDVEQTYPCKDCDKVFQTKSSLKNHRRRYHITGETECRICLLPLYGLQALRAHLRTHTDVAAGTHQCPHCPKRFKYRHSLAKHADTHLEKTHGCPECSKMFGSPLLVKLHMKTHERMARGTTYHCSYCGKGFYETYNLNIHERTHRNDKPFKCDICESCFVTNSSLKRHLKVSHSGAKPHTCKVCQKCFSTESIRDRHELRVHTDQNQFPHPCQLCPRRYMKPKDLRNHTYKMHSKKNIAICKSEEITS